jgi:gamma-glutamylcyclotransferase (GGCT)/AIG2-like uncharacterized protein YtfP
MLIFVYGTLLKNMWNNWLLDDSDYRSKAVTVDRYTLYVLDSIPKLSKHPLYNVRGELYDIPEDMIKDLDRFENEGVSYKRELIKVIDEQGHTQEAYVYFGLNPKGYQLPFGDYREFALTYNI